MRKIIHVDMDCYFAAVEMRDNPAYRQIPLAIGGASDRRGVISTCNYIAREYGIRSAMASAEARKRCPQLVLIAGRMDVYVKISRQIRRILQRYTPHVEPLSLDEAYLDVTDCRLFSGSATLIAEDIRRAIYAETGLTASAGVAPCKFVAKIASDENKPDGLCVVPPQQLDGFVMALPLGKIPGVGKVTLQKLQSMGLHYCDDIRGYPFDKLLKVFGKFAPVLWQRSMGIDNRSVSAARLRKSVGVETTLAEDIYSRCQVWQWIDSLYGKLEQRIEEVGRPIHTQGIKLKFSDFQQTTVELKQGQLNKGFFAKLLDEELTRQQGRGIRLVGLHAGLRTPQNTLQLTLPFA